MEYLTPKKIRFSMEKTDRKTQGKQEIFDLVGTLLDNSEMQRKILVKIVLNAMPGLVRDVILNQKSQKLSYGQISEIWGVNKSTIFKIENDQFFPKSDKKQLILIKKAMELIKNGN